jgi:hypothetical protein
VAYEKGETNQPLRQERVFDCPFPGFIPCSSFLQQVSRNHLIVLTYFPKLCRSKEKVKSLAILLNVHRGWLTHKLFYDAVRTWETIELRKA